MNHAPGARPALDERADTLDVSATIVDLAVRKYLRIEELPKEQIFGIFSSTQDYELTKLEQADEGLLSYERTLVRALFGGKSKVRLSDLKGEFHENLRKVKDELYMEAVKVHRFFPQDPERVRLLYRLVGLGIAVIGGVGIGILGAAFGAALIAIPVLVGGLALLLLGGAMPRRTVRGGEMYRRCWASASTWSPRSRIARDSRKKRTSSMRISPMPSCVAVSKNGPRRSRSLASRIGKSIWYIGPTGFVPLHFAMGVRNFSSSVSNAMASTPGGSGASGFSGGGFSGGGGGGGGGGSW